MREISLNEYKDRILPVLVKDDNIPHIFFLTVF